MWDINTIAFIMINIDRVKKWAREPHIEAKCANSSSIGNITNRQLGSFVKIVQIIEKATDRES